MGQGPLAVFNQYFGGNKSMMNLTAATLIKPSGGCLYRVLIEVAGATSGAFTFNDSNCLVTAQTITGITAATQAVVTVSTGGTTNPFAVNNTIAFTSVGGMTQINAVAGQVVAIGGVTTAWTITTNINSSAFSAWTSGGTAASYGASNQFLTIPYNATADVAGSTYTVDWPCQQGILMSTVPGTAGIAAVAYA